MYGVKENHYPRLVESRGGFSSKKVQILLSGQAGPGENSVHRDEFGAVMAAEMAMVGELFPALLAEMTSGPKAGVGDGEEMSALHGHQEGVILRAAMGAGGADMATGVAMHDRDHRRAEFPAGRLQEFERFAIAGAGLPVFIGLKSTASTEPKDRGRLGGALKVLLQRGAVMVAKVDVEVVAAPAVEAEVSV